MEPAPKRILVVDDEPDFAMMMGMTLEQTGRYDTRQESDSTRALAAAREFRPDLVLLDCNLPGRDGFEVCAALRAAGWDALRIVMLTAKGREAEVTKGLQVGADAYVTKPFSTRDLVGEVARLLSGDAAADR